MITKLWVYRHVATDELLTNVCNEALIDAAGSKISWSVTVITVLIEIINYNNFSSTQQNRHNTADFLINPTTPTHSNTTQRTRIQLIYHPMELPLGYRLDSGLDNTTILFLHSE